MPPRDPGLGGVTRVEPFTTVGDALRKALASSVLLGAAKALIDRDCQYLGPNIVIPCADHGEAMRLVRELRAAIEQTEAHHA
jgi:UDP-N-acetylmuramoylalanine-D-glutamate ligase